MASFSKPKKPDELNELAKAEFLARGGAVEVLPALHDLSPEDQKRAMKHGLRALKRKSSFKRDLEG